MMCPFCNSNKGTKVVDVRTNEKGVRMRRRECKSKSCRERVTTYELTQIQILEKLDQNLPYNLVDRISEALAITFPEREEKARELFDFYFEQMRELE